MAPTNPTGSVAEAAEEAKKEEEKPRKSRPMSRSNSLIRQHLMMLSSTKPSLSKLERAQMTPPLFSPSKLLQY
jgi:hypothetical protein